MRTQEKIHQLTTDLSAYYAERDTEIKLGVRAVLIGEHFLQIGPPGTAKSMLARDLARAIDGRYFWALMNRHMTPDQLFGPPDIGAIRNEGRLYYVSDGMLQEAHIAFLDEIFKCSAATLNDLLSIVNERIFKNGDQIVDVPLVTVFGASNELPSNDSEELGAFWDRFLLRIFVNAIRDPSQYVKMLRMKRRPARIQEPVLTIDELYEAREQIYSVEVPGSFEELMVTLRDNLSYQGIEVSDRRWTQAQTLCQAEAWLDGRAAVQETDTTVLQHVLWNQPTEVRTVLRVILANSNPLEESIVDILDQIEAIEAQLHERIRMIEAEGTREAREAARGAAVEWYMKLQTLGRELNEIKKQCETEKRPSDSVTSALDKLLSVAVKIAADILGLRNFEQVKADWREKIYS